MTNDSCLGIILFLNLFFRNFFIIYLRKNEMLALETSGAILDQDEVRDDFVPNSNDREDASNSTNDKEQEYVFFENKYLGEE